MPQAFLRIICILSLLLPIAAYAAPVDEYPSGPITAICTYSVGSQTDVQARICAMPAEKYFGQPIVILNKAGAGGLTGWNWFMDRGSRDGLTMTVYNLPNFIAQSIVKKNAKYSIVPLSLWRTSLPTLSCCLSPRTPPSTTSPTLWNTPERTRARSH